MILELHQLFFTRTTHSERDPILLLCSSFLFQQSPKAPIFRCFHLEFSCNSNPIARPNALPYLRPLNAQKLLFFSPCSPPPIFSSSFLLFFLLLGLISFQMPQSGTICLSSCALWRSSWNSSRTAVRAGRSGSCSSSLPPYLREDRSTPCQAFSSGRIMRV